jgi:hypothetical protein
MELAVTNWVSARGNFLFLNTGGTSVDEGGPGDMTHDAYELFLENTPNPFRFRTAISFTVPAAARGTGRSRSGEWEAAIARPVEVGIYNATGQHVRTLLSGELAPGPHRVVWNGRTEAGADAASGVFFCRLVVGEERAVRSMVMIR